ncbi:MAG TPA: orotidine-5'-phosphate decarboxylase [Candidatus Moranbacteria bacterium]|nr:MAG: Orotidine 5'-phosphate decarboxylase [Parcubacteria group bacterium GW2011_GWC1_45_14]HAV11829.1 orotidine-5'-phosphate decarboxylase [Candidatus Moranbacteria bacterium]
MQDPKEKIILAADVSSLEELDLLIAPLKGAIGLVKIGKQLFTRCGPAAIRMAQEYGFEVFLDLKYHDIPNTVAQATLSAACHKGVKIINLHALGGREMMEVTAAALRKEFPEELRPKLIAVTILTSSTEETLGEVGIFLPVKEMVIKLAELAKKSGMDGVVASPQEAVFIREACGPDFLIVTPGVRPADASLDDQKRVATTSGAIKAGADYLVIGRPITAAPDRVKAAQAIAEEIYLAQRKSSIPAGQASPL